MAVFKLSIYFGSFRYFVSGQLSLSPNGQINKIFKLVRQDGGIRSLYYDNAEFRAVTVKKL
jgi:hypothetical protein